MSPPLPIILASRSPRRRELLQLLIPPERIEVLVPPSAEEQGFDGLTTLADIEQRLREIALVKLHAVADLARTQGRTYAALIAADTTIVAQTDTNHPVVLGQPPATPDWPGTVRQWFLEHYAGREHEAWTALCVSNSPDSILSTVVKTRVRFTPDVARWLDWYLSTGESVGKAGGYALQGAASLFIEEVRGSLTNVIGLPVRELAELLSELQIDVGCPDRS